MKQTILILVAVLTFLQLTAQSKVANDLMKLNSYDEKQSFYINSNIEIDSLHLLLSNTKQENERLELLLFYLKEQFLYDISKGEQQAQEALSIARKLNKPLHEALSLRALSTIYSLQISSNISLLYLDSAFDIANHIDDRVLESSLYYNKYIIYLLQENHAESINNFLKCIELAEKYAGETIRNNRLISLCKKAIEHNNYSLAEKTLNKINYEFLHNESKVYFLFSKATIHQVKNQIDSTLFYYNKAYTDFSHSDTYQFIGDYMVKTDRPDSALQLYYKAVSSKDSKESYFNLLYIKIANIYQSKGAYDSTEYYFAKCLDEAIRLEEKTNEAKSHARLASFYFEQQQYRMAQVHADKAHEFALRNNLTESLEIITGILGKLAAQENKYDKAYEYAVENNLYLYKLNQQKATNLLRNLEIEHDLKIWSESQEKKIEKAEKVKNLVMLIAAFFLVASGMLYLMYRNKNKALRTQLILGHKIKEQNEEILSQGEEIRVVNENLSSLNNELESRITERTEELRVANKDLSTYNQRLEQYANLTSHNLRAPLANMKGLLNLYSLQHDDAQGMKVTIQRIRKSSEEMDDIIQELIALMDVESINMTDYESINVSQLINQTEEWLINKVQQNVVINKYLDIEELNSVKHFIEPILKELFLNAFNYRNHDSPLEIAIGVVQKSNSIEIKVKDNGLGIDLNNHGNQIFQLHQRFHQQINGRGIGLYLVKRQIEALKGTISIDSQLNYGTCFTILLPMISNLSISHSVA